MKFVGQDIQRPFCDDSVCLFVENDYIQDNTSHGPNIPKIMTFGILHTVCNAQSVTYHSETQRASFSGNNYFWCQKLIKSGQQHPYTYVPYKVIADFPIDFIQLI